MGSFHGIIYNHCLLVRPAIKGYIIFVLGGKRGVGGKVGLPRCF